MRKPLQKQFLIKEKLGQKLLNLFWLDLSNMQFKELTRTESIPDIHFFVRLMREGIGTNLR